MKKNLLASLLSLICAIGIYAQTVTSVANGNWTSPATWGGVPPVPGNTVIINHTVTLDMDWGYSSGSITINASGALNGNSPMRGMAIAGGTLTVNGTFNVARTALYSGTATNGGTFISDSLYLSTSLTNNTGATINAAQFLIYTGGNFTNNGSTASSNFLNMASITSSGTISSNDFLNSKSFTNSSTGVITVWHDFSNSDSLATPAVFTNNGSVIVNNDWANFLITSATVNGSGKFCVAGNSFNSGTMSGTFDFCDQTGGNVDLNTGTIAGTITQCLFTCSAGIAEAHEKEIGLFPNPATTILHIDAGELKDFSVNIFDAMGNLVGIYQNAREINLSAFSEGLHFVNVVSGTFSSTQKIQVIK